MSFGPERMASVRRCQPYWLPVWLDLPSTPPPVVALDDGPALSLLLSIHPFSPAAPLLPQAADPDAEEGEDELECWPVKV